MVVTRHVGRATFCLSSFLFFAHSEHAVFKAIRDEPWDRLK
jgi:hypothetical protein